MSRVGLSAAAIGMGLLLSQHLFGQVNVLTYHNNARRTGENTNETVLTLTNVNQTSFGKLFTFSVDGHVYAQPLHVSGINIPGQGTHNIVFVATQHNSVYAFDADSNAGVSGGLLWHLNLGPSAATPSPDFGTRYGSFGAILPEVGITGTPVIDASSGTLYVDALTHEGASYFHKLHALNITNGTEQPFSPVIVSASIPGTGVGSTNGLLKFEMKQQLQRSALTLAGGIVYVAYAGYGDSFIRLSTSNRLAVADYFTPYNQAFLADNDIDVGSGGVLLLPDQPGPEPHLMVGAGKQGVVYLMNRDMLTTGNNHYNAGGSSDAVLQTVVLGGGSFDTPAYFNG